MFTMGVGMVYSRNQDPMYLIKRGIKTMLLGLVVNIGEFFLPHYLAGRLLGAWDIFPIAVMAASLLALVSEVIFCRRRENWKAEQE